MLLIVSATLLRCVGDCSDMLADLHWIVQVCYLICVGLFRFVGFWAWFIKQFNINCPAIKMPSVFFVIEMCL